MCRLQRGSLAVAAALISVASAQDAGWAKSQVNATMCSWTYLRAATIVDTVYLDGGDLSWLQGFANGQWNPNNIPEHDYNPLGIMYKLNFNRPFNMSTNVSELLERESKVVNGQAAAGIAPNYQDGAILANDYEFFLYGGLIDQTDQFAPPDADDVLLDRLASYGAEKSAFKSGIGQTKLPENVTRYVTYGGAANAPSENKAWYFGGYRSPSAGPIYTPGGDDDLNPINVSSTLITLDMTTQMDEKWTNVSLPSEIKSRANPELVWVPVGEQGILVVVGGVTFPEYATADKFSKDEAQSETDSPKFMTTIDIYDIAGNKWYQQSAPGGPPGLTQGCAVVAPAQDHSSYNIYYYGGFDGLDDTANFNDDVWILSLPSFMWMKVSSGSADHGRAGHKCVMPYPDQMITIGGGPPQGGRTAPCLAPLANTPTKTNLIEVFNLTEGKWMESYDPTKWSKYGVPQMIHLMIGGDYDGGATMTTPSPSGWADDGLASVFSHSYDMSKITTHYPYNPATPTDNTNSSAQPPDATPNWLAPVLGVVLGLVFVTAVAVAILLYRRRRLLRRNGGAASGGTDDDGHRILSWIRGQTSDKAPTVTTDDTPATEELESHSTPGPYQQQRYQQLQQNHQHGSPRAQAGGAPAMRELQSTPLVELWDTSPAAELDNTGLSPVDVINKHSHFATQGQNYQYPPRSVSTPTTGDQPSSYMGAGGVSGSASASGAADAVVGDDVRPDSPSLPPQHQNLVSSGSLDAAVVGARGRSGTGGEGQPQEEERRAAGGPLNSNSTARKPVVSDVSELSERERAHLRNLSQTSDVSGNAGMVSPPPPPVAEDDGGEAAATSSVRSGRQGPSAGGAAAPAVGLGLQSSGSSHSAGGRRSVFRESRDDLGEGGHEESEAPPGSAGVGAGDADSLRRH